MTNTHSKLINAIKEGKNLEADELFQRTMAEKAIARLEQLKKDTAQVLFNKKDKK